MGVWRLIRGLGAGDAGDGCVGARPVHLIITMIKWIRTSRLSIKNSLSAGDAGDGCLGARGAPRIGAR